MRYSIHISFVEHNHKYRFVFSNGKAGEKVHVKNVIHLDNHQDHVVHQENIFRTVMIKLFGHEVTKL